MLIKSRRPSSVSENAVTPRAAYRNRREIITAGMGALAGLTLPGGALASSGDPARALTYGDGGFQVDDDLTSYDAVTGYNNFYEFGTGKDDPARYAHAMTVDPWSITVEGEANKTGTFALEDVVDFNALEERIYRFRCVEAWSMVIPWVGVPLADVLAKFEPTSNAKYVAFLTKLDRSEMRGVRRPVLDWPYQEGLRIDEAMHPLAFAAVGLYGETLLNQNGAPFRTVLPWKYGYKSAKSIVTIRFQEEQPATSWNISAPNEYGFYSNVNPERSHPRWSQTSERIIGGGLLARRETDMFNGYAEEVGQLYAGMDLIENH